MEELWERKQEADGTCHAPSVLGRQVRLTPVFAADTSFDQYAISHGRSTWY